MIIFLQDQKFQTHPSEAEAGGEPLGVASRENTISTSPMLSEPSMEGADGNGIAPHPPVSPVLIFSAPF